MSDINIIQMNIMLYCTTKVQEDNVAKGYKRGFEAMQRLFLTLLHYIRHASNKTIDQPQASIRSVDNGATDNRQYIME